MKERCGVHGMWSKCSTASLPRASVWIVDTSRNTPPVLLPLPLPLLLLLSSWGWGMWNTLIEREYS
jgi:hypothetical protein